MPAEPVVVVGASVVVVVDELALPVDEPDVPVAPLAALLPVAPVEPLLEETVVVVVVLRAAVREEVATALRVLTPGISAAVTAATTPVPSTAATATEVVCRRTRRLARSRLRRRSSLS